MHRVSCTTGLTTGRKSYAEKNLATRFLGVSFVAEAFLAERAAATGRPETAAIRPQTVTHTTASQLGTRGQIIVLSP